MICGETFSFIHSLPSHCWESSPSFAVISDFFSGQVFDFFFTLHSDLQDPGWRCLLDISKIYLVHQSLYFHLTSPLPITTIYHLLGVLHIVRFASVAVITNIKNRSFKWKHISFSMLYISLRSTTPHNFSNAIPFSSCQQFGSSQKVTALNLFSL